MRPPTACLRSRADARVARIALVHDIAGVAAVQAELLRRAGHVVDQVALPEWGAAWQWPAKAFSLPVRVAGYMPEITRLRSGRYDVVHIHWLAQGIVGILAGGQFFAQAHGSDLHLNMTNPVYRRVTRAVLRRARAVFYVTPNLRAYMKEFDAKLRFLPNPVDVNAIAPSVSAPTQVSRVLIFTRIDPVKGVDRIFPAAERLGRLAEVTAPEWGPLKDEYMARYGKWVKFAPLVPHSEIGAFVQRFDVVVGQMHQGILSLSEIEAMAAGRPVITGIDRSLYEGDQPPVIDGKGPDEIVAAVERLKAEPRELARLAEQGREWVRRNHSYGRHLRVLEETYFGEGRSTAR
jgi:glycosyltransferase involved in cell wall biosynthesis